jgi:hypothetical protein
VSQTTDSELKTLTPASRERYLHNRRLVEETVAKHPAAKPVFEKFLREHLALEHKNTAEINEFNRDNKALIESGKPGRDFPGLDRNINRNVNHFIANFHPQNIANADLETQKAWATYTKKVRGPNLVEGVVSQFYNSEKGGLQIGGLIGVILGGIAGYKLLGASGGGIFGIGAAIVATLMGAWLGNKGADLIGGYMRKDKSPSPAPGPEVTPAVGRDGQEQASAQEFRVSHRNPASVIDQGTISQMASATRGMSGIGVNVHPENSAQLASNAPAAAAKSDKPTLPRHG